METLWCLNQWKRVEGGEPDEAGQIRHEVRKKLKLYRDTLTFVVVVGALALADGLTGGGWWVQWLAAIWGGLLFLAFLRIYVRPVLWGRDVEDRIVERELQRRGYPPQDRQ